MEPAFGPIGLFEVSMELNQKPNQVPGEIDVVLTVSPNLKHNEANAPMPVAVKQFAIRDFQCLREVHITHIPVDTRWIFLFGDNGDGKTSLLQSLAIGLTGARKAEHLLEDSKDCWIGVEFLEGEEDLLTDFSRVNGYWQRVVGPKSLLGYGTGRLTMQGAQDLNGLAGNSPVSSLYTQDVQLRNIEPWLKDQKLEAVDGTDPLASERLANVKQTLIDLLPNVDDITMEGHSITYREKEQQVPVHHLSAGHKSILAMIGDLLIQLMEQQKDVTQPKDLVGIVLIDELEIHLHPKWQARLPRILSAVFPKIQFIASTHSPLPLIGAPAETVLLKVKRDSSGTGVERLKLDPRDLLPNSLLTSPLFDMETLVSVNNQDFSGVHTGAHFNDLAWDDAQLRRLADYRDKGLIDETFIRAMKGEDAGF